MDNAANPESLGWILQYNSLNQLLLQNKILQSLQNTAPPVPVRTLGDFQQKRTEGTGTRVSADFAVRSCEIQCQHTATRFPVPSSKNGP